MKILEKIYRRLLKEAEELSGEELSAKITARIERALKENLAIYKTKTAEFGDVIVLYSPSRFLEPMQNMLKEGNPVARPILISTAREAAYEAVIGIISIDSSSNISDYGPCDSSAKVGFVAAKEGYGPLLYDVAISLSPSGKIMSSRDAVSDYALKVYRGMHKRSEVTKKPFVNKDEDPETKAKTRVSYDMDPDDDSRDCEVWYPANPERKILDYSFSKSSSIDISRFLAAHQNTLVAIKDILQALPSMGKKQHSEMSPDSFFSETMETSVSDFFADEYGKVPGEMQGRKKSIS